MKNNRNRRRGSLMLESSLILLVFMMVLIGTFDISQLLFIQQSIAERVRVAARYGAVNTYDQTAIENMVLYSQPTVPASGTPAFSLTRAMITVARSDAGTPEDRVSVTVSNFPVEFITPVVAGIANGVAVSACASYELF